MVRCQFLQAIPERYDAVSYTHLDVYKRQALTGPVSRGDTGTVAKHLEVMPADLVGPYCAFSRAAGELSLENGTITENQYEVLKEILAMAEGVQDVYKRQV